MFGVPLLITSRITSSRPPSAFCDRSGPYFAGEVICSLTWQTMQDWLKRLRPRSCCGVSASAAGNGCAMAAAALALSINAASPDRRFIRHPPIFDAKMLRPGPINEKGSEKSLGRAPKIVTAIDATSVGERHSTEQGCIRRGARHRRAIMVNEVHWHLPTGSTVAMHRRDGPPAGSAV